MRVYYRITRYEGESAKEKAEWISLEQTVELPSALVSDSILNTVKGQIISLKSVSDHQYELVIDWPEVTFGNDRVQFLNVLYGNISLKKGIKVIDAEWETAGELFHGPSFGIQKLREKFGFGNNPWLCGVLKPMGSDVSELADLASEFALGGIHCLKDDHGLINQGSAPFEERVHAVTKALDKAADKTGIRTRYFVHISGSVENMKKRVSIAREAGADGIMIIPGLTGFEAMHELATNKEDALPVIAHPAFTGTFVTDPEHGFSPEFLYGSLNRVFGADFSIYPNSGGRFSFSAEECAGINSRARDQELPFNSTFPMPGGGMKRNTLRHWAQTYGPDTVFLMGADLMSHPEGITTAVKEAVKMVEE